MKKSRKRIAQSQILKELYLDIRRKMLLESKEKPPSLKTIETIIKSYEDLILLYMISDYRILTKLGTWSIAIQFQRTTHDGKPLEPPRLRFIPRLYFPRKLKKLIWKYADRLVEMRSSNEIVCLTDEESEDIMATWKNLKKDLA